MWAAAGVQAQTIAYCAEKQNTHCTHCTLASSKGKQFHFHAPIVPSEWEATRYMWNTSPKAFFSQVISTLSHFSQHFGKIRKYHTSDLVFEPTCPLCVSMSTHKTQFVTSLQATTNLGKRTVIMDTLYGYQNDSLFKLAKSKKQQKIFYMIVYLVLQWYKY